MHFLVEIYSSPPFLLQITFNSECIVRGRTFQPDNQENQLHISGKCPKQAALITCVVFLVINYICIATLNKEKGAQLYIQRILEQL